MVAHTTLQRFKYAQWDSEGHTQHTALQDLCCPPCKTHRMKDATHLASTQTSRGTLHVRTESDLTVPSAL